MDLYVDHTRPSHSLSFASVLFDFHLTTRINTCYSYRTQPITSVVVTVTLISDYDDDSSKKNNNDDGLSGAMLGWAIAFPIIL